MSFGAKSVVRDGWRVTLATWCVLLVAGLSWQGVALVDPRAVPRGLIRGPFLPLLVIAVGLPIAAVGACLYAALRRLRARDGEAHRVEVLPAPGLLALATFVVAFGVTAIGRVPADAALMAAAGVPLVALVAAAGLLESVCRRSARPATVLVIVLVAMVCVWLGGGTWLDAGGARRLATYRDEMRGEAAAERARIAAHRLPVLRGEAVEGNAVTPLQGWLEDLQKWVAQGDRRALLRDASAAGPVIHVSAQAAAAVEERRADVEAVRVTSRYTAADWQQFEYLKGWAAPSEGVSHRVAAVYVSPLGASLAAAELLTIDGHAHAQQGDLAGAAERYLDVVRFGEVYDGGPLVANLVGIAISDAGVRDLGRLLVHNPPASLPRPGIDRDLAILEPSLPTVVAGLRSERIGYAAFDAADWQYLGVGGMPALRWVFPVRATLGEAVYIMGGQVRRMEEVAFRGDGAAARRLAEVLSADMQHERNPIVVMESMSLGRTVSSQFDLLARVHVLRAALRVEQAALAAGGRYPGDASALDLPVDPWQPPARVRYAATGGGTGFRVWSIGMDGSDDGGANKKDLVLERAPSVSSP